MARAQRTTEIVRTPKRVKRIQLTLTEGDADFLLALVAATRGDNKNSPRKYAVRIGRELEKALGIHFSNTDAYALMDGYIDFENYADPEGGREKPAQSAVNVTINPQIDPVEFGRQLDRYLARYRRQAGRPRMT